MKRRSLLLSFGALVAFLLAVREMGAVQLSAYVLRSESACRTSWRGGDSDRKASSGGGSAKWRDDAAGVIRVSFLGPNGPFEWSARLTRFEVGGPCWVPLRKSGTATFTAELRGEDQRVLAEFEGEFSMTVTGPCSLRELRSRMRDGALDYIDRSIDDHI